MDVRRTVKATYCSASYYLYQALTPCCDLLSQAAPYTDCHSTHKVHMSLLDTYPASLTLDFCNPRRNPRHRPRPRPRPHHHPLSLLHCLLPEAMQRRQLHSSRSVARHRVALRSSVGGTRIWAVMSRRWARVKSDTNGIVQSWGTAAPPCS